MDLCNGNLDHTVTRSERCVSAKPKPRRASRHWRCPSCGTTYDSPVPILGFVCGRGRAHKSKADVEMRAVG
jgi:hypothetical protein